jgi:hypothetical protein
MSNESATMSRNDSLIHTINIQIEVSQKEKKSDDPHQIETSGKYKVNLHLSIAMNHEKELLK